jgi:hypothetical protein
MLSPVDTPNKLKQKKGLAGAFSAYRATDFIPYFALRIFYCKK